MFNQLSRAMLTLTIAVSLTEIAFAQTPIVLRVDYQSPATSPTGASWSLAYPTFQAALDDARDNTQLTHIWVAKGTYKPTTTFPDPNDPNDHFATFFIPPGVSVFGGFNGYDPNDPNNPGESLRTQRNPEVNLTILDGDIDGDDVATNFPTGGTYDDNVYHVVRFRDTSVSEFTTKFSGFVVQNGHAVDPPVDPNDPNDLASMGGGILIDIPTKDGRVTTPLLDRLVVQYNYAKRRGGGMLLAGKGELHVANCRFQHNVADGGEEIDGGFGGGCADAPAHTPVATFQNCVFWRNETIEGQGGGFWGSQTFVNCTFHDNTADWDTGSVTNGDGDAVAYGGKLVNCIVWGDADQPLFGPRVIHSNVRGAPTVGSIHYWVSIAGNLNATPLFRDASAGNLTLRACSPELDAGLDVAGGDLTPAILRRLHRCERKRQRH